MSEMILTETIIIALSSAFILLLLRKVGAVEWLQLHGNDFIHELASCEFCLSWWICLFISLVRAFCTGDWVVILFAALAAPVTRKLL
jgi:hypothetical protein